jgi:hypothetical protein
MSAMTTDYHPNRVPDPELRIPIDPNKGRAQVNRMTEVRKQFPIVAALATFMLLLLPATVKAQFNYTTNNGAITITKYTGSGGAVNIPSIINDLPVTRIGSYAFQNCGSLNSVTIPVSVTSIGSYAFDYCTSLTNVTIPSSVTSLGELAFWGCISLTHVTIPDSVTSIGDSAFSVCTSLTSITIPNSITSIGDFAFYYCDNLKRVHFKGNAPDVGSFVFDGDNNLIVYYLPGTTGWGATFGGRPTALWNPLMQTSDASFGVRTNQFGFTISGTADIPIVVEAASSLASTIWVTLQSCTLTNGSTYFSDPQWADYPSHFYRIRSP